MMNADLKYLLNKDTKGIYKKLKSKYKVKAIEDCDYFINILERRVLRDVINLHYDFMDLRADYFAHELLHAKVYSEGFRIARLIDKLIWDFPLVYRVLDRDIRNIIGNIIEHEKIYQEYLNLGFDKETFIGDYGIRKCSVKEIHDSINYLNYPSLESLKYIAVKYFMMRGKLDYDFDYEEELRLLSNLAPNVYSDLEQFWNNIKEINLPYELPNQISLVNEFLNAINKSYSANKINLY